jgi:very-short-patch-repair endonuclease
LAAKHPGYLLLRAREGEDEFGAKKSLDWRIHMPDKSTEIARMLRKNQTESEKIFWRLTRDRGLFGKRILRQHPIRFLYFGRQRFFVADFYCPAKKLVIELDGKIHEFQKDYDELRTYIINQLGYQVVRVANQEMLDIERLQDKLRAFLE